MTEPRVSDERLAEWIGDVTEPGPLFMAKIAFDLRDARAENVALRAFANDVLKDWPESAPDEFDIQDIAEKHGLLLAEQRTEFCGECCSCAEYHGDPAGGFTCYRLRDDIAALAKAKEGM